MPDVLLVEDEPAVAEVVRDALVEAGLTVAIAENDAEAYAKLATEARTFSALVADINLGRGTTGFDVARRARRLNPALKIVFITGYASYVRKFVDRALMFSKPFDPSELAEQVKLLINDRPATIH